MFDKTKYNRRYYGKTSNGKRNRLAWEDWELFYVINKPYPDHKISEMIGRSVKSIQVKRSRLKLNK